MATTPRLLLLCIGCLPALLAGEQPTVPDLATPVVIQRAPLEIDAGDGWSRQIRIPDLGAGQHPLLALRAYAQGGGGCNYVLQVLLDGLPLGESPLRRRLLNKHPWFDPPNTEFHFPWYDAQASKWMTMFGREEPITWGGTGRDTEYLFDLTGLVTPGHTAKLELKHAMPGLPAAIKRDRAPLVVSKGRIGTLDTEQVSRLRALVQDTASMHPVPVRADLPPGAVPGSRYYELEWSKRPESPPAQVAFDDLAGWRGTAGKDAEVTLDASLDHLLWRRQVAKLEYLSEARATTVFIQPPTPIEIAGPFDAASMWLYADFERMKERHPHVTAHLADSAGRDFTVDLGTIHNSHWVLLHGVLPQALRKLVRLPARFLGVSLGVGPAKEKRRLYLESIAFYERKREPFTRNTRPVDPTFPYPGQGSLPAPPAGLTASAQQDGEAMLFKAVSEAGTLHYRIRPDQGVLNGISAKWNG